MKPPFTSNKILNPSGDYAVTKDITQFNRDCCLKQEKIAFDHGKGVNIYIVYEINDYRNIGSYPTPENCLFVAAKLTKHIDVDLYKYSGYGIGFGRNVIIFGVDMSSSPCIDNKKKDILNLCKGSTQRLKHTLAGEKLHSVNFTKENTKFCLSLHYPRANSYLLVNGTEIIKFKAKYSKITAYPLCLGNISKHWSVGNMKKNWIKRLCLQF